MADNMSEMVTAPRDGRSSSAAMTNPDYIMLQAYGRIPSAAR